MVSEESKESLTALPELLKHKESLEGVLLNDPFFNEYLSVLEQIRNYASTVQSPVLRHKPEPPSEAYFLIDEERSIPNGPCAFWKKNGSGYTYDMAEAGAYYPHEIPNTDNRVGHRVWRISVDEALLLKNDSLQFSYAKNILT